MFLEVADKNMIEILYSIYHPFNSKDHVLRYRRKYGDSFVSLSTNYTRAKAIWLEDPIVQRKYNQFREKSAYLSDGSDRHLFQFLQNELDVQAHRISKLENKRARIETTSAKKSHRKKSSMQRASNTAKFTKMFSAMSDCGKLSTLSRLSDILDCRLCYFVSVFLATRKFIDFFSQLPEDVSKKILEYLSPQCLLNAGMVSKAWKNLVEDKDLWKSQIKNASFPLPEYDENLIAKDFFMKHARRFQRWKSLNPLTRTISKWPATLVVKLNDRIISGSKGCVRIWESSKINIEPEGVVSIGKADTNAFIPLDNQLLIFCSNGYLKVLDFTDCASRSMEEPKFEQKLSKHPLTCASRWHDRANENNGEVIVVGDGDGNIIIYNYEDKAIKMKKKIHKDEVLKVSVHFAFDMEDAIIVSGGKDFSIKVTKLSTLTLMHSFSIASALTSFHVLSSGEIIIVMKNSVARSNLLRMKSEPVWETKVSTYFTSSEIIFQDGQRCMVLIGTIEGKIYIVDAESGSIQSKTRAHRGEVKSMLQIEDTSLLSADAGGIVFSTFA